MRGKNRGAAGGGDAAPEGIFRVLQVAANYPRELLQGEASLLPERYRLRKVSVSVAAGELQGGKEEPRGERWNKERLVPLSTCQ